jgi:hypothetical protein
MKKVFMSAKIDVLRDLGVILVTARSDFVLLATIKETEVLGELSLNLQERGHAIHMER